MGGCLLTRQLRGLPVVPARDLLDQSLVVVAIERHRAMDQDVEENAQGPAVHLPEGQTSLEGGGQQDWAALAPTPAG